jgi:hypothetical protein
MTMVAFSGVVYAPRSKVLQVRLQGWQVERQPATIPRLVARPGSDLQRYRVGNSGTASEGQFADDGAMAQDRAPAQGVSHGADLPGASPHAIMD